MPTATEPPSGRDVTRRVIAEPRQERRRRWVALAGWGSFLLIGWIGLLVPSLIRSIEHDFGQSDAGLGLFYLVNAAAYGIGSLAGGLLTERFGRRLVLAGGLAIQAIALVAQGVVLNWAVFLVAAVPRGLGSGAIDGGAQALFLEVFDDRPVRALNVLHVFFSIGSLVAPLALASAVDAGIRWPALFAASGLASTALAAAFVLLPMPAGRRARGSPAPPRQGRGSNLPAWGRADGPAAARPRISRPLVAAALAIACYVAAEVGISSWLVGYLGSVQLSTATLALSLFWAGLTLGRLLVAPVAERFDPVRLAAAASILAGLAIAGALLAPTVDAAIVLFGLAGLAFGPIYPTIIVIGARIQPGRSAAVTGLLAGVAVAGAVAYPPLMGAISVASGLGAAMLGTAILSIVCAVLVVVAGARRTGRQVVGTAC